MTNSFELKPTELYARTDPKLLAFKTTDEVESIEDIIGQTRAIDAIQFGIKIKKPGFNLFALGPSGLGKQSTILQFLSKQVESQQTPSDWCYINNFDHPHKPFAIELPAGKGWELCQDMKRFIDDIKTSIPVAFESDEYRAKQQEIQERYEEHRKEAFVALKEEAEAHQVALIKGAHGFVLAPIVDEKVLNTSEFSKLPEEQQEHISELIEVFEEKLSTLIHRMPQLAREEREEIRKLDTETATVTVDALISNLIDKYKDFPDVIRYFNNTKNNITDNVDDFLGQTGAPDFFGIDNSNTASFRRYEVNLLVDNSKTKGAPVLYEDNPVYQKLLGRVEHQSKMGAMFTDFTLIKPGALHAANGGYLVLDAIKLLRQPFAWEALKSTLYSDKIRIQSLGSLYGIIDTVSLEPEPIPLNLKVVLLGNRMLYYLLLEYDPDFKELFKVAADFDEEMDRSEENIQLYAKMIANIAHKEELRAFDASAVARMIEQGARLSNDSEKLTTHMLSIVDLMRESEYLATESGSSVVTASDVQHAIDAQKYRADRLKDKLQSEIQRDTILIDTDGDKVATINGLAVIGFNNNRFAHPVRITATTRLGDGKVIDIEREVELGGAIHSKGVLILSSFLASRYTRDMPLSLTASLAFEQTYGFVEGDSASAAELCVLLSSLAEVPIHQYLAITGSVNQLGQVQAIGGVNEKIEGFFDICVARGLNGKQGVIIPRSNVKHLMLSRDVVNAVEEKQFYIYSIDSIDQAIEILTGIPTGVADTEGNYPEHSLNDRVAKKVLALSRSREKFIKAEK